MADRIHVGDTGTVLELTLTDQDGEVVNLASASLLQIKLQPPTGSVRVKTASLSNTGTDGKIRYTSLSTDFDQRGEWGIQGYVEFPSGVKLSSTASTFRVYTRL